MPASAPTPGTTAPRLLIGPLLRRVVGTRATIWVETSAPALVRVRAGGATGEAPTFTAYGHHYALVLVDGLAADSATPYQVWLGDIPVWPEPDSPYPPSVIRTRRADDGDQPVRLIFGSCRESTQHASARRLPPDALDAYARRLAATAPPSSTVPAPAPPSPTAGSTTDGSPACAAGTGHLDDWPDLLVLLGDQVYADETSPKVRRWLRGRRRQPDAPADQVITFEEYTRLYLESWRDPEIRYLLSTVPSVMIFDDHEIIDDWNTSASWRDDVRAEPWWAERIISGLASYWVYQHLGNLSPEEIAVDAVYARVIVADDATAILAEFGAAVDSAPRSDPGPARGSTAGTAVSAGPGSGAAVGDWASSYQWSYALDIGRTKLIMLDNRCSRVLEPARRAMLPAAEWRWFTEQAYGHYDHLVIGSSLPWLLPHGVHYLESWNERLAASQHRMVAEAAETLRRGLDLEHWGAFRRSFERLAGLFAELGSGAARRTGPVGVSAGAPASISVLSGDVHHSYVALAELGATVTTPVHQLVCSPLHNQVPAAMRPLLRLGWQRSVAAGTRWLARVAGLPAPSVSWRRLAGPYFGNAVGTLCHVDRTARVTIEGTSSDGHLTTVVDRLLATANPTPAPALHTSHPPHPPHPPHPSRVDQGQEHTV